MTFPTTSILVDFTTQPDGGPPPTADFGNALFSAEMVVAGGLCLGADDPPENCDAPYTAQTMALPCEVWAILGPDNSYPAASVYVSNGAGSSAFIFTWQTSYFILLDQAGTPIWSSTESEFPDLAEGGGLGMKANTNGSLELWVTYDNVTWTLIHTETGLTTPNPATIGLGNLGIG